MDDRLDDATQAFEAVYDAVPGEVAPKLALAVCAELGGDAERARRHFETVWRTDNTYASAAFGVGRARFSEGDRSGAAQALEAVPEGSRYGVIARMAAMTARVRGLEPEDALVSDTFAAAERLSTLEAELGPVRYHTVRAEVLEAVLTRRLAHPEDPVSSRHKTILGARLTERQLRLGLERSYRTLAEQLPERGVGLVDRANKVRPLTWR
jgi:serine/threonine-protein kinase PknG